MPLNTTVKNKNETTTIAENVAVDDMLQGAGIYHIVKKMQHANLVVPPEGMAYRGSSHDIVYDKIAVGFKQGEEVFVVAACYKVETQTLAIHVNAWPKWKHGKTAHNTLAMALPFQNSSTKGRISCHVGIGKMATALVDHSTKFQEMAQTLMWDNFLRLTIGISASMVDRGQLDKAAVFSPQEHVDRYRKDMLKL